MGKTLNFPQDYEQGKNDYSQFLLNCTQALVRPTSSPRKYTKKNDYFYSIKMGRTSYIAIHQEIH